MINFKVTKPKGRKKHYTITIDNSKSNIPIEYASKAIVAVMGSGNISRNSTRILVTKKSPETYLPKIRKKIYSAGNTMEGGLGAGRSIDDLAKKYKVKPIHYKKIYSAIDAGIGVEKEHTNDIERMKEIAFDHLWETGMLYYQELSKMENKLERNPVKFEKGAEVGDDNDRMRMLALKAKADADALALLELEMEMGSGETKVESKEESKLQKFINDVTFDQLFKNEVEIPSEFFDAYEEFVATGKFTYNDDVADYFIQKFNLENNPEKVKTVVYWVSQNIKKREAKAYFDKMISEGWNVLSNDELEKLSKSKAKITIDKDIKGIKYFNVVEGSDGNYVLVHSKSKKSGYSPYSSNPLYPTLYKLYSESTETKPVEIEPETAPQKEAWEISVTDYIKNKSRGKEITDDERKYLLENYIEAVEKAVSEGKPVSEKIQNRLESLKKAASQRSNVQDDVLRVDDRVIVKGKNGNPDYEGSFRGWSNGEAVVWIESIGSQWSVPKDEVTKKGTQVEPETKPKEAWEMTFDEFIESEIKSTQERLKTEYDPRKIDAYKYGLEQLINRNEIELNDKREYFHKPIIEKALSEGKPVPAEVLADYPELQKSEPEVSSTTPTVVRDAYYTFNKNSYGESFAEVQKLDEFEMAGRTWFVYKDRWSNYGVADLLTGAVVRGGFENKETAEKDAKITIERNIDSIDNAISKYPLSARYDISAVLVDDLMKQVVQKIIDEKNFKELFGLLRSSENKDSRNAYSQISGFKVNSATTQKEIIKSIKDIYGYDLEAEEAKAEKEKESQRKAEAERVSNEKMQSLKEKYPFINFDGIKPMELARLESVLEKQWRFSDDGIMSRGAWLKKHWPEFTRVREREDRYTRDGEERAKPLITYMIARNGTHGEFFNDIEKLIYDRFILKEKMSAGGFIKCPVGTQVQSVLMSKDNFSRKEAVSWIKDHDYKAGVDETENYYRFRQQEPEEFDNESFRTIEFTDGIKAVIGCPINKKMERGDAVKYDRKGNEIGEGSWHIEPEVFEFPEYPQIKSSVDYSQSTESTYVTYLNTENDRKITVRFSQHESNAVRFGDQLDGNFASKNEILYHLGLKKREFIPNKHLYIQNRMVAKRDIPKYEEADKTIQEMYALGANADISMYNGKIAKGSNYLIMGDTVEEIIDTRQSPFGNPVELGKYVYSDIDENNKKAEQGMKIDTDIDGGAAYEGNLHTEGGIPATVKETGQEIEFEVGEIVINRVDAQKHCEELSKINSEHGKKIDCECLRNSNKDENLKDPKMEGEIDEKTGMVKLEKGDSIDKNMEKTLSNEGNIIQDAIENQELEIEEMETATMFENGDKIGGKQRHYKFRDDSFFVVDWVEQDGKQVAVMVDKQPRKKWFSIGESSADQILEDAEKAGIPFDEMLKTLIQNGAFVNIHAEGGSILQYAEGDVVSSDDEKVNANISLEETKGRSDKDAAKIFSSEGGYDTRKEINRSEKIIPAEKIEQIQEEGLSIEDIESLGVPVFKYKTQITIHGNFAGLTQERLAGYKVFTLNQNKTLGVRYNGVDTDKKGKIQQALNIYRNLFGDENDINWRLVADSKGTYIIKRFKADVSGEKEQAQKNFNEAKAKAKEITSSIPKELFVGDTNALAYSIWGIVMFEISINLKAIYEKNVWKLISFLTNGKISNQKEFDAAKAEVDEAQRLRDEENRAKWAAEREAENAKYKKEKEQLEATNPYQDKLKVSDVPEFPNEMIVATYKNEYGDAKIKVYYIYKDRRWIFVKSSSRFDKWEDVTVENVKSQLKNSSDRKQWENSRQNLIKNIEKGIVYSIVLPDTASSSSSTSKSGYSTTITTPTKGSSMDLVEKGRYYINDRGNLEMKLNYNFYQGLPEETKNKVRQNFLFSKFNKAWYRKSSITNEQAEKIAISIGISGTMEGGDNAVNVIFGLKEVEPTSQPEAQPQSTIEEGGESQQTSIEQKNIEIINDFIDMLTVEGFDVSKKQTKNGVFLYGNNGYQTFFSFEEEIDLTALNIAYIELNQKHKIEGVTSWSNIADYFKSKYGLKERDIIPEMEQKTEPEPMAKTATTQTDSEWENILLTMIPDAQKKMMSVSEDFEVNKERLISQLKAMPKLYGQDGKKGDAIAYFHYFVGSLDIYIMEFSKSDDESSPYEFYTFGSAVEGGDFEGSYAYFPDWLSFTPKNIEFDYYFEPTPLRNIQDERNPYYEKEQEAPTADKEMVNIRTKIYSNAYEQNKGIEKFIELAGENTVFTGEDIEFMNRYTGYGGLGKFMDVETVQRTEAVGTLYEYYTPDELCKKLWGLAYKHGFDASQLVLEPSCGIGRIIKYAPNKSLVKAYETNPTSSFIAKATYRGSDIVNDYFESEFYMGFGKRTRNKDYAPAYGLVIGNYPFGDYSGKYASMGEKDYSKATQVDHHFIVRGLDALVSGGLMVCIVNSRFMQGGHDAVKAEIEKRGELIDAYRLPAGVFQNTEVIADILVIRKK